MLDIKKTDPTMHKIFKMAQRVDAFWDRWLVHGINPDAIKELRKHPIHLDHWVHTWSMYGEAVERMAAWREEKEDLEEAENHYRKAAMYIYMNYWIHYKNGKEKKAFYQKCLQLNKLADKISNFNTSYSTLSFDEFECNGRVRHPKEIKGVVILVNPVDSSKEELYQYETDFLKQGFATVSFDGPGQGETYTFLNVMGTNERWKTFINGIIEFSHETFPQENLYLFGTSLGAAWTLYGSGHSKVRKAAAVSPTSQYERMSLPSYFIERIEASFINNENERPVPNVFDLEFSAPVYVFYGNKDLMVKEEDIRTVYDRLPAGKKIRFYEEEGHCCNYKLEEIRSTCAKWFLE